MHNTCDDKVWGSVCTEYIDGVKINKLLIVYTHEHRIVIIILCIDRNRIACSLFGFSHSHFYPPFFDKVTDITVYLLHHNESSLDPHNIKLNVEHGMGMGNGCR